MSAQSIEDVLELCLERMEGGENLESILASFPAQADELRPLLSAFFEGQQHAAAILPPVSAQSLSRAQFLTAAAEFSPATKKSRFTWIHLRLATSALILVGIVVITLLGTGLVSANSLPGDTLYPLKLMIEQIHINMVQDPPARLELQENYDERRLAEAERLNEIKRRQPVTFSGLLEQSGPEQWQVGSLTLDFPQGTPNLNGLNDSYVQITGYVENDEVEVEDLQPRQLVWNGPLQKISEQSWLVGGVTLLVNGNTKILGGSPRIGQSVQVTAIRLSENRYLALSLQLAQESPEPTATRTQPRATRTPTAANPTGNCTGEGENCKPATNATATRRPDSDHLTTAVPALPTGTPQATRSAGDDEEQMVPTKASSTQVPQVTKSNSPSVTSQPAVATATRTPGEIQTTPPPPNY